MLLSRIQLNGIAAILLALAVSLPTANAQDSASAPKTDRIKNNWAVNCGAGETADAPLTCQMMQNVVVQKTNQRLLTVVIRPQPDAENYMLTLALPHGVDFAKGVEVKIDENEPLTVPVQTSTPEGAFSNLPISDKLLAELRAGSMVTITFYAVSGQTFAVPLSLAGFTAAYEKLSSS